MYVFTYKTKENIRLDWIGLHYVTLCCITLHYTQTYRQTYIHTYIDIYIYV